ncbi:MAG: type II 3-dehydroquinate dehydratase [Eubacterium sp.]|nr:type II 3-dehydroquinate dehydratase [Eubacterium sp.]
MKMKILILNGPNLNMTGIRKKSVYGEQTLEEINAELREYAEAKGAELYFYQSNHEGAIIDTIHESRNKYDGVVINAGAYTHYSYAIRDAIESVADFLPYVEVHMSDIHSREDFRSKSVIADVCLKQICGLGKDSYKKGIDLLLEIL